MENRERACLAGLYIHIPFCLRKCPYCDFYSTVDLSGINAYLDALPREMERAEKPGNPFDTIYIGGGTPSVLTPEQVEKVLDHAFKYFSIEENAEITIELNPGTANLRFMEAFRGSGGNRVHLGVQSFDRNRLAFLGRNHTADQSRETVRAARKAGVDNLGLDFIYGLPGQTRKEWLADLNEGLQYKPEHISCYMLTYEKGTPLNLQREKGQFQPLKEDAVRALFEDTIACLGANGYEQYEISNFSRGGDFPSRHNQKYWSNHPYIGMGPSSHSFIPDRRWWNVDHLNMYLDRVAAGVLPVEEEEVLTPRQRMLEAVFLGLRTTKGIDLRSLERRFGKAFNTCFSRTVKMLRDRGLGELLHVSGTTCRLTGTGQVFADTVNKVFAESI